MTEQITNIPDKGNKKRIVIVGGGFGGLKIARKLKRQHYQVVLLDKNNYHLFQPLLYQVATSGIEPSAISFPFRKIFKGYKDHFLFSDFWHLAQIAVLFRRKKEQAIHIRYQ